MDVKITNIFPPDDCKKLEPSRLIGDLQQNNLGLELLPFCTQKDKQTFLQAHFLVRLF